MEKNVAKQREGLGMKLRLKDGGDDALITYMYKAHKSVSWLAREVNMTRTGVDAIIKGKTRRSQTENIEAVASALDLKIGHDGDGLYFYVEDGENMGQARGLVEMYGDKLSKNVGKLTADQRRVVEEIVDLLVSPEDRDILRIVLDALRLKRDRKVM